MSFFIETLVGGLLAGVMYSLVAIGFVIIFGTMNLVTFAHGEVYMAGAFAGYFALTVYRLPWPVALVYISGVAEIVLGALLLIPGLTTLAGWGSAMIKIFRPLLPTMARSPTSSQRISMVWAT